MNFSERDLGLKNVGYESLIWVNDDNGKEFSCSLDKIRGGVKSIHDLTDHERSSCMDVNSIVGTERW